MQKRKITPPIYFVLCLLLAVALNFSLPSLRMIPGPYRYIGVLLIALGIWLNLWADHLFKHKKTTVKPFEQSSALIEKGPFLFTRNPMYLGMIAILAGTAVGLGSVIALISPIAFYAIARFHYIPAEEQALKETFGDKFHDYKRRVRRWM